MFRIHAPRWADLLILAVALAGGAATLLLSDWSGALFAENGVVEALQLVLLVVAFAFFARGALRTAGWAGLTMVAMASFSVLFAVRETPRCTSPFYDYGPCFDVGWKDPAYASVALVALVLVVLNRDLWPDHFGPKAFRALPRFLTRLTPLLVPVFLLAGAQLFETLHQGALEELSEMTGYAAMALLGLRSAQYGDQMAHLRAERDE